MKNLFLLLVALFSFSASAQLQRLELEKLYIKWLPGNFEQASKCFKGSDLVLDSRKAPKLLADSRGLFYNMELELDRLKKGCGNLRVKDGQEDAGLGLNIRESDAGYDSLILSFKARLPFEHVFLVDDEGREIELLLEGKLRDFQELGFLNFFKRSRFMGRMLMISKPSVQLPIVLLDYELPTFFDGKLLLQVQMGQSLLSFTSSPLYYGLFDVALGYRLLGAGHPFEDKFNLRLRAVYEGTQINDPNGLDLYPVLGTRLFGGGLEGSVAINDDWGVWSRNDYLMGITPLYQISKVKSSISVSYRLSRRWRIEAGSQFAYLRQNNRVLSLTDSLNEIGFFTGLRLNPKNLLE